MFVSNNIGIVADDLTGADDTALQFHLRGANTQIILDSSVKPENSANTQAWAISTETRNIDANTAVERVKMATEFLRDQSECRVFLQKNGLNSARKHRAGMSCDA